MNSLGKQAVSTGSVNQCVEIALLFLCVCFQDKQSVLLKISRYSFFLQNRQVLHSFENKAYPKPCRFLDKSVI